MRSHHAGATVLTVALLALAVSASAFATTTGIVIENPQLVVQRGRWTFNNGMGLVFQCNSTMLKRLIVGQLIPVREPLTRLGKVRAGRLAPECPFNTRFLNLPLQLGEGMPGPLAESWDISFLSSNLATGALNFGILDFQVRIVLPGTMGCLYRGTLLGTLSADGRTLTYASGLPLAEGLGCPGAIAITGTFTNEPAIAYSLLIAPEA
ncbi:MAG TPA: hypothetical protein VFS37_10065 [Conexibacter sp.]|nr:hypothetical protein [Conexibacter sp.]